MLLEELFLEIAGVNYHISSRPRRGVEVPTLNYDNIHADDPVRKAWHTAGGNPPGYGPERIADHLAALQVGKSKWNSWTDEQKAQWHEDNPSKDPSLPPPPTLAQRQAETARRNSMSPEELEAEDKRKRAEDWEKKKAKVQAAKAEACKDKGGTWNGQQNKCVINKQKKQQADAPGKEQDYLKSHGY